MMAPSTSSTLAVNNLPVDVTEEDLKELFSKEGPLDSVDFESSTCGVVKFRSRNDAKEAMDKLNETELKGKPMIIMWCEKQCPSSNAKLWVLITGPPINNDDFKALLSRFGAVDSFDVVLQRPDASYWIVQFDSETSATNAINFSMGDEKYDTKFLVSKYNDCKKLCVEYHPKDLVENNILRVFSLHGECTVNIENKSSGIAFVSYHTSEGAEEAMRNLKSIYSGPHHLCVRGIVMEAVTEAPIFVIKEDKRKQLVATINMAGFHTILDFLRNLIKLGADHRHVGPVERIRLDSPWPGYEVEYKHVDSKNAVVIPFKGVESYDSVEPCFSEDPYEHFDLWFLGMVNQIEFKAVPPVDLNA